jgi:tetratricopeptide (TPR) repeat protein
MDWYKKGIEILRDLPQEEKSPGGEGILSKLYSRRAEILIGLSRHEEALADMDRAMRLEKGEAASALPYLRAGILARMGKHAQAIADANKAAGKEPRAGITLYNLACVHALASAAARKDDKLDAAEREKTAERYAAKAVELLEKARTVGHFKTARNVADLKDDADLESLQSREDFKRLRREVEK